MEKIKAETQWFHVFKDMIESGDLAKLEGSDVKVYLVIKAHVNFSNGHSFPGIELIAREAGISVAQVKRCQTNLEKFGYLTKTKIGRRNDYKLREKIAIFDGEQQTAMASWDYAPCSVKHAIEDLRNVLMTGNLGAAQIVHIEKLVIQTQVVTGDGNLTVQAGQNADELIEKLTSKNPELAAALLSIKERQEFKKV